MTSDNLMEVLVSHAIWMSGEGGCRANLYGADLREANLYGADLREANLYGADLREANLREANLRGANLYGADLYEANLYGADLYEADLRRADLYEADLYGADLREADLREANLREANLRGANLYGADLYEANLYGADLYEADLRRADLYEADLREAIGVPFIPMCCPDQGEYTAFKKANGKIVVLKIPEDAIRFSATGRKCRTNKAMVVRIENLDGSVADMVKVHSNYDTSFVYEVGKIVSVDAFDMDRFNECSAGIHHFINRQEAVDY